MSAFTYCPGCAARLPSDPAQPHAAQSCASCGTTFYHNAKPAAGALILRNRQLLLVQRAIEPFRGYWDIPGGFLEPGEHPAATARREALEETGLVVELEEPPFAIVLDQYGDAGDHTLNVYYVARVVAGDERAADDACAVQWFPLDALPERIAFDHTHDVLRALIASRGLMATEGRRVHRSDPGKLSTSHS